MGASLYILSFSSGCCATRANWWLRSPNRNNSNNFCIVNSDGSPNNNNANNSWGLAVDLASLFNMNTGHK